MKPSKWPIIRAAVVVALFATFVVINIVIRSWVMWLDAAILAMWVPALVFRIHTYRREADRQRWLNRWGTHGGAS